MTQKKKQGEDVSKGENIPTAGEGRGAGTKGSAKESENTIVRGGGNNTMTISSIAIILSIIAILLSLILLFTSIKSQVGGARKAQKIVSENIESTINRLKTIEEKLASLEKEGADERTQRGLLELRKALISFQEARNLIEDEELSKKLLKIEDEMKAVLALPKPRDIGAEGKEREIKEGEEGVKEPVIKPEETTEIPPQTERDGGSGEEKDTLLEQTIEGGPVIEEQGEVQEGKEKKGEE